MAYVMTPIDMDNVRNYQLFCGTNPADEKLVLYRKYFIDDDDLIIHPYTDEPLGAWIALGTRDDGLHINYRVMWGESPKENGFVITREVDTSHPDLLVSKWGDWTALPPLTDEVLSGWFIQKLNPLRIEEVDRVKDSVFDFRKRLGCFNPRRSLKYFGKITLYQTRKSYTEDNPVAMKPGRAIKFMFPELSQSQVDSLVDRYQDKFSPRAYNIHSSYEASDFTKVYTSEFISTQNINHSSSFKSLSNSCMRYKFDGNNGERKLPVHPVEAYASGDFQIIWALSNEGLIGGRVVVYMKHDKKPQAAPIYGACQQAIDLIVSKLESIGAEWRYPDWEGAKLKAIVLETHTNSSGDDIYIAPYLDLSPRTVTFTKSIEGSTLPYLLVDSDGEIDASGYSGLYDANTRSHCYICEDPVDDDDEHYSDYNGEMYCDHCYCEQHILCNYTGDWVHTSECIEVNSIGQYGRERNLVCSTVPDNGSYVDLCSDDRYWDSHDTFFCEDEGQHISSIEFDENYFMSDWDCEVYHNDHARGLFDGTTVSASELEGHYLDWVYDSKEEVWKPVETEEKE